MKVTEARGDAKGVDGERADWNHFVSFLYLNGDSNGFKYNNIYIYKYIYLWRYIIGYRFGHSFWK